MEQDIFRELGVNKTELVRTLVDHINKYVGDVDTQTKACLLYVSKDNKRAVKELTGSDITFIYNLSRDEDCLSSIESICHNAISEIEREYSERGMNPLRIRDLKQSIGVIQGPAYMDMRPW